MSANIGMNPPISTKGNDKMNDKLTAETIQKHLANGNSATVLELAEAIDAPLRTVYAAVKRLKLAHDGGKPRRYYIAPPSIIDVLKRHRAEIDEMIATLEHLETRDMHG